ncbi:hypothetical protein T484DRAFT_2322341 [Baffinella frigidus]|nr:hypothetical protein T484DRAFT_2322341 [Cryptophyta sp. CCMP2293]
MHHAALREADMYAAGAGLAGQQGLYDPFCDQTTRETNARRNIAAALGTPFPYSFRAQPKNRPLSLAPIPSAARPRVQPTPEETSRPLSVPLSRPTRAFVNTSRI